MDIFNASDKVYLPQVNLSLKSRNGLNYESAAGSNIILEFDIPASVGYYLAEDTVLSFDFEYVTSGEVQNIRVQQSHGLAGMIRQLDCYTKGGQGTHIEQLLSYSVLQGALYSHDCGADRFVKDGEYAIRSQTECYCLDDAPTTPFTNPVVAPTSQTYDAGFGAEDVKAHSFQKQTVQLPIRLSSILGKGGKGSNSVIPVGAMGGISCRFQLLPTADFSILHSDDIMEEVKLADWVFMQSTPLNVAGTVDCIKIFSTFNGRIDDGTGTIGTVTNIPEGIYSLTTFLTAINALLPTNVVASFSGTNTNPTGLTITNNSASPYEPSSGTASNANFFVNFCKDNSPSSFPLAAGANATFVLNTQAGGEINNTIATKEVNHLAIKWKTPTLGNPFDLNTVPFFVGTTVQVETDTAGVFHKFTGNKLNKIKAEPLVSVINPRATLSGGATQHKQDGVILCSLTTPFDPTGASGLPSGSFVSGGTIKTVVNEDVFYRLTNVSLNIVSITPPPQYQSQLLNAVNSDAGLDFPISTFECLRTNVNAGEAITQSNLPYRNTKAKSIISIPSAPGARSLSTFTDCNLLRPLHLIKHYYQYANRRHPALGISSERIELGLQQTPEKHSLSQELIKAQITGFEYALGKVRSLDAHKDCYKRKVFFLARNLGILASAMNLQDDNLSLTLEATSGKPIEQTLTLNHFLYASNILNIKSAGVEVFR